MDDWYVISNVDRIDSPALAFYPDRISGNIELAKRIIGDTNRLRPHVKTNKAAEVSRMLLDAGIRKFKCATIAEASAFIRSASNIYSVCSIKNTRTILGFNSRNFSPS